MPAALSSFCTSSRLSVKVLTRKSRGADALSCVTKGQNPSPTCAFNGSTNHSGRLWRWRSNKSDVCTLVQASNQAASCLLSAPNRKSSGLLLGLAWRFCAACLAAAYLAAEGFTDGPSFATDSEAGLFAVFCKWSANPKIAKRLSFGPEPDGAKWS